MLASYFKYEIGLRPPMLKYKMGLRAQMWVLSLLEAIILKYKIDSRLSYTYY